MHYNKVPNFHAILSQYMSLNNLFGYPQNLSLNTRTQATTAGTTLPSNGTLGSPHSTSQSPKESTSPSSSSDKNVNEK